MDPLSLIISAGMNAIPQIFKMFSGGKRMKEAKKTLAGLDRPQMTMPESMEEAVGLFRGAAMRTEIPGQNILTGDIKGGTAGGIEAMLQMGGSEAFGGVAELVGQEQEAISGMAVPLAQMKLAAEQQFGQALFRKGETEKEMEEWNKIQAWKEKYFESQRRLEKGREDLYGGFETAMGIGGDIFSGLLGSGGIYKPEEEEDFPVQDWMSEDWLKENVSKVPQYMTQEDWVKLGKGDQNFKE